MAGHRGHAGIVHKLGTTDFVNINVQNVYQKSEIFVSAGFFRTKIGLKFLKFRMVHTYIQPQKAAAKAMAQGSSLSHKPTKAWNTAQKSSAYHGSASTA